MQNVLISLLVVRNFIFVLSFLIRRIIFEKMSIVLIGLGVCFFTKRVHILVKVFKDFNVFKLLHLQDFNVFCLLHLQDFNVFNLYIPKT